MSVNIAVPSRFSCLKIEDEDPVRAQNKSKEVKKKNDKKPDQKKVVKDPKIDKLNGVKKATAKQTAKKDKKKQNTQWEEWKQKDDEYVNDNFEEDLENAILQSKLEFEYRQQVFTTTNQDAEKEKSASQNKKKKNKSMSLDQFLHADKDKNTVANGDKPKSEVSLLNDNFFEKVQSDAKKELNKEEIKENRKKRDANIDEIVCKAQYQEKLNLEKARVVALQSELDKCKSEIICVKQRNQTLCNLLSNGEMKDKARVLEEIEKISGDKNDLIKEMSRLHVENEQLRSKLASFEIQNNKHKEKKRKQKGV